MKDYELRTLPVEIRALDDGGRRSIEGRAIVYDAWSEDLGGFRERLAKGSARLEDDLLALFDHDTSMVLGRTSAGTMRAHDDGSGVTMVAYPPDTTWARDLLVSMDRGDIRHMSFRLLVKDDRWEIGADGTPERTILDMDVSELSVVSMPAYPQTSSEARSKAAELREGRVLSQANFEKLTGAHDTIGEVLDAAVPGDRDGMLGEESGDSGGAPEDTRSDTPGAGGKYDHIRFAPFTERK